MLGDAPMETSCWRLPEGRVVLLRWRYAEDEQRIAEHFATLDLNTLSPGTVVVDFREHRVRLFDSSASGRESDEDPNGHLDISLPAPRVSVSTDEWRPDGRTFLVVHCLRSLASTASGVKT